MTPMLSLRRRILDGTITVSQSLAEQQRHLRGASSWHCLNHVFPIPQTLPDPTLPLAGIGLAHKDMFLIRDRAPQCGARVPQHSLQQTSPFLDAIEQAGATCLATTVLAEFAAGITGENQHAPSPVNPLDPAAAVGGSSSGSAVAVAAGLCPGSVGTDTAGSIRIPAATCGLVGFKPARNTSSQKGCFPLAPSLDTVGLITRTALDAAYLYLCALPGPTRNKLFPDCTLPGSTPELNRWAEQIASYRPDPGRIAYCLRHAHPGFNPAPTQQNALHTCIQAVAQSGAEIEIPGLSALMRQAGIILHAEAAATHMGALQGRDPSLSTITRAVTLPGAAMPAAWYATALAERPDWQDRITSSVFRDHDILLTPVLPLGVPDWDQVHTQSSQYSPKALTSLWSWVSFVNYLDLPAIVFPIGRDARSRPVCLQAIGRPGSEAQLLALADQVQRTFPASFGGFPANDHSLS